MGWINPPPPPSDDLGCCTVVDPIFKTWKLFSSENITLLHCSVVQCACFFVKDVARRCKGHCRFCKMLFFHSLINQRLFGCYTTRKILIFLKVMLDCLDFYLLQQLWVEILQLQGCQTRVFLEFLFHDGVSQSSCLSSSSTKLMLGNSVIWKLFGYCQEPHDGCFPCSPSLTYDFYQHLFLSPCKNTSFFSSLMNFPGILSKIQTFKTSLHKLPLLIF